VFPKDWPRPIRGAGGVKLPESTWVERPNAWLVLHTRYAAAVASGKWDPTEEHDWLFTEFVKLVPTECGCQATAADELAKIDLTTAATAERSAFDLHNFVSVNRVEPPKPTISWQEYLQLYPRQ
jgi:hypothetical protein